MDPPKPTTRLSTLNAEELRDTAAKRGVEPQRLGKLVRGELDCIVMKALEQDRARRYESALARDIEDYLQYQPVEACPPSATYLFEKPDRESAR